MPGTPWILRSLLFVPGNRAGMVAKAPRYRADAIILDLEDGVAPEAKAEARRVLGRALDEGFPPHQMVFLRVNGVESGLLEQDLGEVFRPGIAGLCLPKCDSPEGVHSVDARLRVLEERYALRRGSTRLLAMIESARGVINAPQVAAAHERIWGLAFGAEDFTADIGVARTREGGELGYARAAVSVAAHAAGVEAVDGIFADFGDASGLYADTVAARSMGYTGKMLIHPAQIAAVHAAFAPTQVEVEQARRIVDAFADAQARGLGIAVVDGAMVDLPVMVRAQRILAVAARTKPSTPGR
jgi:citrate lyase subunit beta/citryl-CoA lyase